MYKGLRQIWCPATQTKSRHFWAFLLPLILTVGDIVGTLAGWSTEDFIPYNTGLNLLRSLLLVYAIQRFNFIRIDLDNAVDDIFKTMEEPVLLVSAEGKITRINRSAEDQLLFPDQPIRALEIHHVLPDFDVQNREFEAELMTQTGMRKYACTHSDVVRKDRLVGRVLLLHDVTRDREIAQMKTNFTATVSHEIRTPLTALLGFARMTQKRFQRTVLKEFEPQNKKETRAVQQVEKNLSVILSEGRRLTKLVDEVLNIARMESGTIELSIKTHDLGQIIEHALASAGIVQPKATNTTRGKTQFPNAGH